MPSTHAPESTRCAAAKAHRSSLAALLLIAAAGCFSPEAQPGPALRPAPLPSFTVGDAFTFDDDRTESVVASSGDRVHWTSFGNFTFTTYQNVLLPRLEWESVEERGERALDTAPTALWPLAIGNSVRLTARQTVLSKKTGRVSTTVQGWSCRVSGTATVKSRAGTYDTYRIVCRLESDSWLVPYEQERTFYYAPAVRYYVRREERYRDGGSSTIELVDFRTREPALPDSAGRIRKVTVQQALETKLRGSQVAWRDERGAYKGNVEPVRTFRTRAGRYCRDYHETIDDGARLYRVAITACRSRDGRWLPIKR